MCPFTVDVESSMDIANVQIGLSTSRVQAEIHYFVPELVMVFTFRIRSVYLTGLLLHLLGPLEPGSMDFGSGSGLPRKREIRQNFFCNNLKTKPILPRLKTKHVLQQIM